MKMLTEGQSTNQTNNSFLINKTNQPSEELLINALPLTYFDLLDETPEYSEAAILLDDGVIEYCYIKVGRDGSQYFGFSCALPGAAEHEEIISRHKLTETMAANTFERYPSGKTILSKGGKILEINMPQREPTNV